MFCSLQFFFSNFILFCRLQTRPFKRAKKKALRSSLKLNWPTCWVVVFLFFLVCFVLFYFNLIGWIFVLYFLFACFLLIHLLKFLSFRDLSGSVLGGKEQLPLLNNKVSLCKLIDSLLNLTLKTGTDCQHRCKVQIYIWKQAAKECFGQGKTYSRSTTAKVMLILSERLSLGVSYFL